LPEPASTQKVFCPVAAERRRRAAPTTARRSLCLFMVFSRDEKKR
jgi:hypothetical protein